MTGTAPSPSQKFLNFIAEGRLCLAYDAANGAVVDIVDLDGSSERALTWKPALGTGTVAAAAVYRRRYVESHDPPYNVAIIRLAEGPMLLSTVEGIEGAPVVGTKVQAAFAKDGTLVFRPD